MVLIFGSAFDPPHLGHFALIKLLLNFYNPEKIILMPSGRRGDKVYHVSDDERLEMLRIFQKEIADKRVIIDPYFVVDWQGEMITRDVDLYVKGKYAGDAWHVFGSDVIASMPYWDAHGYAAIIVKKIFIPRSGVSAEDMEVQIRDAGIQNYEIFSHARIPDISSTKVRGVIPGLTGLGVLYEENPKFQIPGLSKNISRYILESRLYRPRLKQKPKVLVHVCCGPDVTMPILKLRDEYDVICFWYDPNIQPRAEHDKRYDAFVKVCEIENIPYIKGAYDVKNFFTRIRGVEHTPEKGEKCTYCYDMRMYVAAKLAARLKIPYYTSSLNTSPKKDLEKLFVMGHKYADQFGVEFLDIPFRKRGGFEHSVSYTTEHDIYRQNYCGCVYSIREGGEGDMKQKMNFG